MKIFATFPGENWILDRISQDFRTYKPDIATNNLTEADILWLLDGYSWRRLPVDFLKSKKIVLSVHHVTPEKFNVQDFINRDEIVDTYHVPCKQTYEFIKKHTSKPIHIVGYWYNPKLWQPLDKNECRKRYDLKDDEYVVGSFQRDTEGFDLKTPKLEKGPDLFCNYMERLSEIKNVHVLLGGWRRQYVISRLENANIKYTYKEMTPLSEIQKMYAACDLYLVSSRYEGGPQAVLEASSMKVPIISTSVGMAPDILTKNCIIDVENEIYFPSEGDVKNNFENVKEFAVQNQIEKYENMFREIK
jgi:glycosyltransferase involved in cell wall biosynthesis